MNDIPFSSKGLFSVIPICSNSFSLKKHGDDSTISCVSYLIFTNDLIMLEPPFFMLYYNTYFFLVNNFLQCK